MSNSTDPERLRCSHDIPFVGENLVGIAITPLDAQSDRHHVGIVFRHPQCMTQLLHLAWHHRLIQEELHVANAHIPSIPYSIIVIDIDPIRIPGVIAKLDLIYERHTRNIPYGILYNGARFDDEGLLRLGQQAVGLTCATFVIAALESARIRLLRWEEWQPRAADGEWFNDILGLLRAAHHRRPQELSLAHLMAVEREQGCARYRPSEVAGSALASQLPASFDDAVRYSRRVIAFLNEQLVAHRGNRGDTF